MFYSSIKIAFRGFLKNRFYTALNYVSLVTGLFVAFVCIEYINFEFSYDQFHKDADAIYRVVRSYRSQDYSILDFDSNRDTLEAQIIPVKTLESIPGIKDATQFIVTDNYEYVEWDGKRVQEKGILTTNTPSSFVTMFTWKLLAGSLTDFSQGRNKVILTAATAKRIFGKELNEDFSAVNSVIKINGGNYSVAAVIADVPLNSHFTFSIAINQPVIDYWGARVYVKLDNNIAPTTAAQRINANIETISPRLAKDPLYAGHQLQPIRSIHLKSNVLYELKPPGNYYYISMIVLFAVFITIITLFNYCNFTLALKSKESKSIGIKKTIGATKYMIIGQFLMEGILLALLAIPVVMLLIPLLVPSFNTLMGVSISASLVENLQTAGSIFILAVILGLLSGLAPAILFSGKKVLSLFKSSLVTNRLQFFSFRKYLVISQFSVVIIITCVSYFIVEQLAYIRNKDVGFEKRGVVYAYTSEQNLKIFQQRLRQVPEINAVGNGSSFGINTFNSVTYRLSDDTKIFDNAKQFYLDYEALKAYQIKMLYGSLAAGNESRITLINRTAAEQFASVKKVAVQDIIGTTVITEPEYTSPEGQTGIPFLVDGIIEDINIFSLREKVEPYFITVSPRVQMGGRSIIAFNPENQTKVLSAIYKVHKDLNDPYPVEVEFLDTNIDKLYRQDMQVANLLLWMNLLAVMLTILGVTGITVFLLIARIKEIGIRRVLGASKARLIYSAIKEYIVFISIAFLIACPIAFTGAYKWLNNFAYRIELSPAIFFMVGVSTLVLTALLVSIVTIRMIDRNPVKSLRSE